MTIRRLVWPAVILAHVAFSAPAGAQAPEGDVFALLRSIDEAAARQAWPGFRLSDWPLAVFDGAQTLLLRHPSPPPEFEPLPGRPGTLAYPGRHPAVVGNSVVEIAGARTGTVVAIPGSSVYSGSSKDDSILLAYVEEVFHVFWRSRHANFRPNEMARYAYPVKDVRNLRRMLAEDEALARAIEAGQAQQAAAWAATALEARREREALLTADDRAFEIGIEMLEGPANYVARLVVGLKSAETVARLRAKRAADQIRWRYYDSGAAICLLLDRFQPDWKTRIDGNSELTIVALLDAALTRSGAKPARFRAVEVSGFEAGAARAIAELSARQERLRKEIQDRPGPRVVVDVAGGGVPFRLGRFDPVNLMVLDGGEVAHPRYITLSGPGGTVEVTNPAYARGSLAGIVGLTRPAGRHPLGNGIRSVTIVGLEGAPTIERREGRLVVEAKGVRIALEGAEVRTEGETLRISVAGAGRTAAAVRTP